MSVSQLPVETDVAAPGEVSIYRALLGRLADRTVVAADWTKLVDDAVSLWSRPGFDTLVTLPRLAFTPYDHQVQAASAALRRMRGRAILADEVGLGKTIEAGLVLSELRARGLADRVLVVAPAGLVTQWQEELDAKFLLPSVVPRGTSWDASADRPIVVTSLATARRDPLRSTLANQQWDLVIVDEAHRVRSPRTVSGRFVRSLPARYLLLLTATPVENRLADLFELVSLVSPGLLGSAREFRARHAAHSGDGARAARDVSALQSRVREVMVRHRRSALAVMLPQRVAETVRVTPAPAEAQLYAALARRLRAAAVGAPPTRLMALRQLARRAGSSPVGLAPVLARHGWTDLAERAAGSTSGKDRLLIDVLERRAAEGTKVVVFTGFRRTLDHLVATMAKTNLTVAVYHGGLSRKEKEQGVRDFQADHDVLVTTEAAGEGRNLQFCHVLVNYDLPWNPMQIEQRLGRLHRIGQQHDVELTNLVTAGTVDDRLLHVLESKINLFELVVGELDMILGRVEDDLDFEARVFATYVEAQDDVDFANRLDALGERLAAARNGYLTSREATDTLVGDTS